MANTTPLTIPTMLNRPHPGMMHPSLLRPDAIATITQAIAQAKTAASASQAADDIANVLANIFSQQRMGPGPVFDKAAFLAACKG